MHVLKRIEVRQDELTLEAASNLEVGGFGTPSTNTDRRILFYELALEWDDVEEDIDNNRVKREGRQAGIRLDLDVLRADGETTLNIYIVALQASAGLLDAKYRFRHYGLPTETAAMLPTPTDFKDFDADVLDDVFAKIERAKDHLANQRPIGVPAPTDRFIRDLGDYNSEENYARSVYSAMHSLAWALTGKTIWDARKTAKRKGFDPDVISDLYVTMGARDTPHHVPRKDAWRAANRWKRLVEDRLE